MMAMFTYFDVAGVVFGISLDFTMHAVKSPPAGSLLPSVSDILGVMGLLFMCCTWTYVWFGQA